MRIAFASVLALILFHGAASSATVNHDLALACHDLSVHGRLDRLHRAGYKAAMVDVIEAALRSRQCESLPNGLTVRIEDAASPYVCVAKAGTKGPCLWLHGREVDGRE